MAIFGDANMNPTQGGSFANYLFAFLFFILLFISSFCNPYVFLFYRREKQNISAILFQILTVNDFCTCLVGVPYNIYLLLRSDFDLVGVEVQPWQVNNNCREI
jgi:hypothetical protein